MMTPEQADERVGKRVRICKGGAEVTLVQRIKGECLIEFPGRQIQGHGHRQWFPLSKLRVSTVFDTQAGIAGPGEGEPTMKPEPKPLPPPPIPNELAEVIRQIQGAKAELAECRKRIADEQQLETRLVAVVDELRLKMMDAI